MLPFQKICGILQWNEGGDKYMNAKDTLETVWKGLMDYADANKVIEIKHRYPCFIAE